MSRVTFENWVVDALKYYKGKATIIAVAKHIWENHSKEIETSDFFYTWQYDFRWAATSLRKSGIIKSANISPKGVWELN